MTMLSKPLRECIQSNTLYHGSLDDYAKRSEITVFVWEWNGKYLCPKLNFTQFMNHNVKILGRRLCSPKCGHMFEGCSLGTRRSVHCTNFPYICLYFFSSELLLPSH